MRLLNVDTFKLEEFLDHRTIRYAIFSHTWDEKEVSFADMQRGLRHSTKALPHFKKIRGACRQAARDGFQFVWVDTCCIDNSSSAELSEALNSMFRWYSDAGICYAYLSDVVEVGDGPEAESQFRNSRWFTRGWTLQELLAPNDVVFYSREWVEVGSKREFASWISEFTGIDLRALESSDPESVSAVGIDGRGPKIFDITRFSVAERMSWASDRVTTRQEDVAYCLLGLFGVNMALLYGEGERAFIRLEEEIIKSSDDHSIFAWTAPHIAPYMGAGLLATSPLQFKHSRGITTFKAVARISRPYLMTNKGLSIKMNLLYGDKPQQYFAVLDCRSVGGWALAIRLEELIPSEVGLHERFSAVTSTAGDQFTRVGCDVLHAMQPRKHIKTVELFVRQIVQNFTSRVIPMVRGTKAFMLDSISIPFKLSRVYQYVPDSIHWSNKKVESVCMYGQGSGILVDIPESANDWVATAIFKSGNGLEVSVMLGWTKEFDVSVHVCGAHDENSDRNKFGVELKPLSSCTTRAEIMHKPGNGWDEVMPGELKPMSVRVDTRHELSSDALYMVLLTFTVGVPAAAPAPRSCQANPLPQQPHSPSIHPTTSNPTTMVPTQRRNATDRQLTTTDKMDTQRPPKKPARVYGKKKQVSKSAGIFLQDSSPARGKKVEKTVEPVEEKREEVGKGKRTGSEDAIGDKKLATESREGGSPTTSRSSSATQAPEATKTTNAKTKKSKSSRAKEEAREQKEKDNGESQPAADGHNTPKPPTKPKAFSDPEALADLTHTLNALQLTSTSPPASQ
ncbi:hypothetical protein V498_09106, partial [Pseudogymnoascus sp. VKM F-4517 (FW-2822)]